MEKYFKPLCSPSTMAEIEQQGVHHHHRRHHHHLLRQKEPQGPPQSCKNDGHIEQGPRHHPQHHHQHTQRPLHAKEDEILYNHNTPVTLSRASSSLSSSSSSSSSYWYTEPGENDAVFHGEEELPKHSLSCSNIPGVRRDDGNGSEPVVFVTVKHGDSYHHSQKKSHRNEQQSLATLQRGHSRSEEGPLQSIQSDLCEDGHRDASPQEDYGPLYKSASLSQSLGFSEEDIVLGASTGPKRAVSSSQLPSKGILKNSNPALDIRKAKSMEVLSPRVAKAKCQNGEKVTSQVTPAQLEDARESFLQTKLQFSAFLDEITKQVLSPSDLSDLRANGSKTVQTAEPGKPPLPLNAHSSAEEREQHPHRGGAQQEAARRKHRPHSHKRSNCIAQDKLTSYIIGDCCGSPPPNASPPTTSHNTTHVAVLKDRTPSPSRGQRDKFGGGGTRHVDNPKTIQPEQPHQRRQQPTASHVSPNRPHRHRLKPPSADTSFAPKAVFAGVGHGSESLSSKSDSSRTEDTDSSQSPEHHTQTAYVGQCTRQRDTRRQAEQLQALQDENADLHQNLLQTVVCIEGLEVELQRTRDELSNVKAKYKSLLETHSGTRQAGNLLGEHLQIMSESLSSDRTSLLSRVTQLSSELQDAHRAIAALENINVPCLIHELVEKHFDPAEAAQTLLKPSAPVRHPDTSPQLDSQSLTPKKEAAAHDWLAKPETGPQRLTAFMPWKQEGPAANSENQQGSCQGMQFSANDAHAAVSETTTLSSADQPSLRPCTDFSVPLPNLRQAPLHAARREAGGGAQAADSEQDATAGVTSASAQQILDDFLQQLHAHKEPGGGGEQKGGQE